MKNITVVTNRVLKTSQSILLLVLLSGLTGCGLFDWFYKDTTSITVSANPKILRQGEMSNVDATVKSGPPNNTPIVSHKVQFVPSTTAAGGLNLTTKATDNTGVAKVVFTAGNVNVDTDVIITGTAKNGAGNKHSDTITVKPPIIFGDFGGDSSQTSVTNADITITPSVTKLDDNKYQFVYVVSSSATPTAIDHMVLNFDVPMDSVTSSTTIRIPDNSTAIVGVVLTNPVTITAICSDCATGGTTKFLIFDGPLPTVPTVPMPTLVRKEVIGPKTP